MLKVLAGFLLGVATTLLVVYWFAGDRSIMQDKAVGLSTGPEQSIDAQPAAPADTGMAGSSAESSIAGEPTEEPQRDESLSAATQAAASEASTPSNPGAPPGSQPGGNAQLPVQNAPASTAATDYPPEIADMLANDVDKELQARYESDSREESWATYMEGQLTAYFASKPALAQFYVSLIDCRTTVCAVHALGYGQDALTQWDMATADLISQPWFDFNSMSMNRRNPQPDILGIVLITTKKPVE